MTPTESTWLLFLTPVAVVATAFAVIWVTGRQDLASDRAPDRR